MEKKKNILMIIPNFGFGGAERSFSKLSLELAKTHNVFVAVFNKKNKHSYLHGGEIIDMQIDAGKNFFDKIRKFFKRVELVKNIKKENQIDLSISFLEGADYVNILSKSSDKIVISIRGSKKNDENIKGFIGLLRKRVLIPFLYNMVDHIVASNKGIKKELRDFFRIKENVPISIIYNFYDIPALKDQALEKISDKYIEIFNRKVLITHGRLAVEKGYHFLLKIFALIAKRDKDLKLVIIGDGPYKAQLYKQCEDLGLNYFTWENGEEATLDNDVFFIGYETNPLKYVSKSTISLLTSSSEGFPNSIAESMACAVPIISVDCPSGPREILSPGSEIPNIPITKPEIAEYGVLMPLVNNKSGDHIALWADFLLDKIHDKKFLEHFSLKSNERIEFFKIDIIFEQWSKVLNKYLSYKS